MTTIEYITKKVTKASTMTEFLKSMQYNDRFGCITVANGERWYPELNGDQTVSMFLKQMYKSINQHQSEGNAVAIGLVSDTSVVVEDVQEVVDTIESVTDDAIATNTDTTNQRLITKALNKAGYTCEPTTSNLIDCFKDYVDAGIWSDLELDDIDCMIANGELTINQMCRALIRL
ncbi:hypothetical protein A616_17285 [Brevibacillus brevis X23]|nr:hypothetical protein A616_17285 [Brevibacillus brevis X23]